MTPNNQDAIWRLRAGMLLFVLSSLRRADSPFLLQLCKEMADTLLAEAEQWEG